MEGLVTGSARVISANKMRQLYSGRGSLFLSSVLAAALGSAWAVLHAPLVVAGAFLISALSLAAAAVISSIALGVGWFRTLLPTGFTAAALVDACLVALVLRTGARHASRRIGATLPIATACLLAFAAWAWLSVAATTSWGSATALGRVTLYAACFACLSLTSRSARPLFLFVMWLSLLQLVLSVLLNVELDTFVGDPHQLGMLLLAGLAGTAFLVRPRSRLLVSIVLLVGIIATTRRGIWIAGAAEVTALLVTRAQGKVQKLAPIALAVALAVGASLLGVLSAEEQLQTDLSLNEDSVQLRSESWQYGLQLAAGHPLLGVGWASGNADIEEGVVRGLPPIHAQDTFAPYNLWINLAASTGIVGAALFTMFLVTLGRGYIAATTAHPAARAGIVLLVGFVVLSVSEMTLYAAAPATINFLLLSGAALGSLPGSAGPRVSRERYTQGLRI